MTIIFEERPSDSPCVETITRGYTASDGFTVRPAEIHWHMVFTRYQGCLLPFVVGPLTSAGPLSYTGGAEIIWIKFKLGTFIPHMPSRNRLNKETILPEAAGQSFWLKGSAWQFPNHENVDTFVDRLVREEILVHDPIVNAVLQGQSPEISSRTVRHRFLRATGLTQSHIRQFQRAQQATELLRQGRSILDTVFEAGYFDQPHLTRSLKHWVGHTPTQIIQSSGQVPCDGSEADGLLQDYSANALVQA